ncbi:tetratricopeptide repeat-containing sensor histidine kinase [Owenweeksia hongkongensis]|uniref:tetratricopeptide repeat-containing sensor histidine kinase n=1 Tax=Owenweeksia hongkongensis TaxID=253245 RepID=UPI003A8D332A
MKKDLLTGGLLGLKNITYFHCHSITQVMGRIMGLLAFLLLLSPNTFSQNTDSLRVRELINESFAVLYSDPAQANDLAKEALKISIEIDECLLIAETMNIIGIVYDVTAKYDSALAKYEEIIILSDKCGIEVMKAQIYNNMGLIYWNTGELDKAIDYYTQALEIFEKHDKKKGISSAVSNIGLLYTEKKQYTEADKFQHRALAIRKEIKDWYGVSVSYVNLANNHMGRHQLDTAKRYLHASIKIKDSLNDQRGLAINYNNLGIIAHNQNKNDSAVYYLRKGINIRRHLGEKNLEASDHFSLAYFYMNWKEFNKAYAQLDTALALAKEANARGLEKKIYQRHARIDTLVGDYKSAVTNLNKYFELEQEMTSLEKEKAFDEIQTRYETEKKERALVENKVVLAEQELKVRQRTVWAAILLAALAILGISAVYIYRQQKLKQQQMAQEARLKEELAKAEVANRIQEERVRISRDLHDHIGAQLTIISSSVDNIAFSESDEHRKESLYEIADNGRNTMIQLRETIWAMNQTVIDLETLVAKTREFVSRLKLDNQKVNVELRADGEADLSPVMAINIFRVVQEAVNNAVKYADFSILEIGFEKQNGGLDVVVEDDGRGFLLNDLSEKGYGLINMKERVEEFNGNLELDSIPGKGTKVKVVIPLNRSNYV